MVLALSGFFFFLWFPSLPRFKIIDHLVSIAGHFMG